MMNGTFSLEDLARVSGLSTRAIRDYIARGLVPPADSLGRGASYSQEHLDRLLALRTLRSRGRGLAEIEQVLSAGEPSQLKELAREGLMESAREAATPPGSALDYLDSLPGRVAGRQTSASRPGRGTPSTSQALASLVDHLRMLPTPPTQRSPSRSTEWVRVRVTPDFEIAARGPLDVSSRLALERAADLLRGLMQ
jgi:DNA-binding transcriptional MerR regulator